MSASLPDVAAVATACRDLQLGVEASELHGGLSGWLAGGGAVGPDWLRQVLAADDQQVLPEGHVLDALRQATVEQIEDRDFGFELLLPQADASLYERSGALFAWCRGFVGAFGLSAGTSPPLSAEGEEALADLVRLAAAVPEEDGDDEDEAAYAEIEEFVRVAALLLHGDCALGPRHRRTLN